MGQLTIYLKSGQTVSFDSEDLDELEQAKEDIFKAMVDPSIRVLDFPLDEDEGQASTLIPLDNVDWVAFDGI